jgi:predicted dehydrogenase
MLHLGLLGAGNISATHGQAAGEIEGIRVSAVCGANAARAEALAARFGAAAYADLEAFLAHRPLDAVAIGSPSGLHAEQGIAAARRGLHVIVEKPVDVSLERADALVAACAEHGVRLGVFFQDRAAADLQALKGLIDSGRLGRPLLASARLRWWRPPEYYSGSRWRGTRALDGGGALINQGSHTVDLLVWLLGDVVRVQARATAALHAIEVEDTLVATLELRGGALATLEATTAAYPGYPRRLELTTTEGTVVVEGDRVIAADLRTPLPEGTFAGVGSASPSASSPVVSDVSGHRRLLADFAEAVAARRAPACDGIEGRRSLAVIEAIYASARTGALVEPDRSRP